MICQGSPTPRSPNISSQSGRVGVQTCTLSPFWDQELPDAGRGCKHQNQLLGGYFGAVMEDAWGRKIEKPMQKCPDLAP